MSCFRQKIFAVESQVVKKTNESNSFLASNFFGKDDPTFLRQFVSAIYGLTDRVKGRTVVYETPLYAYLDPLFSSSLCLKLFQKSIAAHEYFPTKDIPVSYGVEISTDGYFVLTDRWTDRILFSTLPKIISEAYCSS